jgi:hypothetical protein
MSMKKIVVLFFCLGITSCSFAQFAIGVKGGANFANVQARYLGQKVSTNAVTRFHVGAILDASINDYISVQPELLFGLKGGEGNYLGQNIIITDKTSYIELPVSLVGKVELGPGKIFAGAGGYVSALLSGKRTTDTNVLIGRIVTTNALKIGNENGDEYKPLDFGLNFKTGYELENGFFLSASYSLGLSNVQPNGDDNNYLKNSYIGLSAGYFFKSN